ncbi:MAG TPA: hypothetical protein VK722_17775 [Candidatus Aquilonibacter sp.]|jgi:hypothetical protein|nr:hypothetical protein [Candidatus Aquilonibacter sp.]
MRKTISIRSFSLWVAIVLFAAMLATSAGASCGWMASLAPPVMAACHHNRVPSRPQPANLRCCVSPHPPVLPVKAFSPNSALTPVRSDLPAVLITKDDANDLPDAIVFSNSPPGLVTLRI